MDSIPASTGQPDDPAQAFAELRSEVSLLRRAIEGLTAERQNAPDYAPTLKVLSGRLTRLEELMGEVSESPAMRLTAANLALSIERASETARAGDRDMIETASAVLRASIAKIGIASVCTPVTNAHIVCRPL